MALDKQQRRFALMVTAVDISLLDAETREWVSGDLVEVEFAGKLLPSTEERISSALQSGDFTISMRALA